jgi:peroxiredoxin Q/BCP
MTFLKPGDKAPQFTSINENGDSVSLSDYAGKKLILFFYPKDDTPGCTKEACSLRDGYKDLQKAGYEVLGVSPDKHTKHRKFIDKYEFQFSLVADPDKSIIESYGVWGPKKFMGKEVTGVYRTTFLINEEGIIEEVITKVITKDHARQILEVVPS